VGGQRRDPCLLGGASRAPLLPAEYSILDSPAERRRRRQSQRYRHQAQEILRARQRIAELIARETGNPLEMVLEDIERDHWLSAQEAIDYGLVGRIIKGREEL